MRTILCGALLGVLFLAFGHTGAPVAVSALSHIAAQPIVLGIAVGALSRPAPDRRFSS